MKHMIAKCTKPFKDLVYGLWFPLYKIYYIIELFIKSFLVWRDFFWKYCAME